MLIKIQPYRDLGRPRALLTLTILIALTYGILLQFRHGSFSYQIVQDLDPQPPADHPAHEVAEHQEPPQPAEPKDEPKVDQVDPQEQFKEANELLQR